MHNVLFDFNEIFAFFLLVILTHLHDNFMMISFISMVTMNYRVLMVGILFEQIYLDYQIFITYNKYFPFNFTL
jgi:hypothetical protein